MAVTGGYNVDESIYQPQSSAAAWVSHRSRRNGKGGRGTGGARTRVGVGERYRVISSVNIIDVVGWCVIFFDFGRQENYDRKNNNKGTLI